MTKTAFGRDPLTPVLGGGVPELFRAVGVALVIAHDAADAMRRLETVDAVVVDAGTEADLQALVGAAGERDDVLWAGSTGLLRALALALPPRPARPFDWAPAQRPGIVVGSFHPRSRQQLYAARDGDALVWSTPGERGVSGALTDELMRTVCGAVRAGQCDGLVVTGGETAKHLARALGASDIVVLREVAPGIPLCLMRTPRGDLPLITKAGGFGGPDVFAHCLLSLRNASA